MSTPYARILTDDNRSAANLSAIENRIIIPTIVRLGTPKFRRFLVESSPLKTIKDIKAFVDIFHNTSVEIYEAKKHAYKQGNKELAAQIEQGRDIISILSTPIFPPSSSRQVLTKKCLVRENMKASEEEKLSDAEVLAQIK